MLTQRDFLVAMAYKAVRAAIKRGFLKDLRNEWTACIDCGSQALFYDHRDYYQPLKVDPICQACNNRRGPGLPLPTSEDQAWNKLTWWDDQGKPKGKGWERRIGCGGEGWTPLEIACHTKIQNDWETITERLGGIGLWKTGLENPDDHGLFLSRSSYFKSHDPWRL